MLEHRTLQFATYFQSRLLHLVPASFDVLRIILCRMRLPYLRRGGCLHSLRHCPGLGKRLNRGLQRPQTGCGPHAVWFTARRDHAGVHLLHDPLDAHDTHNAHDHPPLPVSTVRTFPLHFPRACCCSAVVLSFCTRSPFTLDDPVHLHATLSQPTRAS